MLIIKASSQNKLHLWIKCLLLPILTGLFACLLSIFNAIPPMTGFASSKDGGLSSFTDEPLFQTRVVSNGKTRSIHSAAVVEISGGRLLACWYGGSRERGRNVSIYSSIFNPQKGIWDPEKIVITGKDTQKDLGRYIKTLGNPAIIKDENSRLCLFYVSISFWGWSGSAINLTTSSDEGKTWTPARRLITSPCFNLSTLVKGPPFLFEDGTIGLPVYHELIGKFGELLCLDREGNVIRKIRISWGRNSIQPVIIPFTQDNGICFMRYCGTSLPRVLSTRTTDGGATWTSPVKTDVPNPDAAVASIRMADSSLLLIHNNSEDRRCDITLSYSADNGKTWRAIHEFESDDIDCDDHSSGFSYPCIIRAQNGNFHLFYSWNNTHIKHILFNQAWVEQQL